MASFTLLPRGPQKNARIYEWSELRPCLQWQAYGLDVYSASSFPNPNEDEVGIVMIPEQPKIVLVNDLKIRTPQTQNPRSLGPNTVLLFHGQSTPDYWRQSHAPHRNITDILEEMDERGIVIDAVMSCNPGAYQLPIQKGRTLRTYPLSVFETQGIVLRNSQLTLEVIADKYKVKGERI
ncbi:MAG: hypothetical protein WC254_07325 [Candidatus Woesearchaeota archaeon]